MSQSTVASQKLKAKITRKTADAATGRRVWSRRERSQAAKPNQAAA